MSSEESYVDGQLAVYRVLEINRRTCEARFLPELIVARTRQDATMKLGQMEGVVVEPWVDYFIESLRRFSVYQGE